MMHYLSYLKNILIKEPLPFQNELLDIWNDLNERNDEVSAQLKISRLRIPRIKWDIYQKTELNEKLLIKKIFLLAKKHP